MTPLHGKSLRSSYSFKPKKIKKNMPRNEIRFCIAAALYLRNSTGNAANHLFRQLGIDWKGQSLLCGALAHTEVARVMPRRSKALLQVERNWIIHITANLLALQVLN